METIPVMGDRGKWAISWSHIIWYALLTACNCRAFWRDDSTLTSLWEKATHKKAKVKKDVECLRSYPMEFFGGNKGIEIFLHGMIGHNRSQVFPGYNLSGSREKTFPGKLKTADDYCDYGACMWARLCVGLCKCMRVCVCVRVFLHVCVVYNIPAKSLLHSWSHLEGWPVENKWKTKKVSLLIEKISDKFSMAWITCNKRKVCWGLQVQICTHPYFPYHFTRYKV